MREIKLTWEKLEEALRKQGVIMEDGRTVEKIKYITLINPRTILIHTEEIKG